MHSRVLVFALILALPCPALIADMVVLANGDKVSGTLVEVSQGKVVIDSPLIGTVNLLRTDVRSIRFGTQEQIEADIAKENAVAIKNATQKAVAEKVAAQNAVVAGANRANAIAKPPIQLPKAPAAGNGLAQALGAAGNNAADPLAQAMNQLQQMFPKGANPGIGGGNLGGLGLGNAGGNAGLQNDVQVQLLKVLSGELGLGDIQRQAKDASRELRAAKRDLQQMGAWNPIYDMYLGILDDFVGRVDAGEQLQR